MDLIKDKVNKGYKYIDEEKKFFTKCMSNAFESAEKRKLQITWFVILNLFEQAHSTINAQLSICAKQENLMLVPLNILYRALIENTFMAIFIGSNCFYRHTDEYALDYYKISQIKELFEAVRIENKMVDSENQSDKVDKWVKLAEYDPKYESLTKYDKKELEKKVKSFSFSRIIDYLCNHEILGHDKKFFKSVLNHYSMASSFVHSSSRIIQYVGRDTDSDSVIKKQITTLDHSVILLSFHTIFALKVFYGGAPYENDLDKRHEDIISIYETSK